jgi:hypothetical protein
MEKKKVGSKYTSKDVERRNKTKQETYFQIWCLYFFFIWEKKNSGEDSCILS